MKRSLLIEWTQVSSADIPIIDDQHRGIVSVIHAIPEDDCAFHPAAIIKDKP